MRDGRRAGKWERGKKVAFMSVCIGATLSGCCRGGGAQRKVV